MLGAPLLCSPPCLSRSLVCQGMGVVVLCETFRAGALFNFWVFSLWRQASGSDFARLKVNNYTKEKTPHASQETLRYLIGTMRITIKAKMSI